MVVLFFLAFLSPPPIPAAEFRDKEFDQRVADYLDIRKRAVAQVPALKPKSEPEQIAAHKDALMKALRTARTDAQKGDILVPSVQKHILEVIRSEMRGRDGLPVKKTVEQGNPALEGPAPPAVKVNGIYPDSAPVSTMPPTLLLRLPNLPKQLSFRFVGKHLVLLDTDAGLIVDYIPNALP
jgi:hypothetical protein